MQSCKLWWKDHRINWILTLLATLVLVWRCSSWVSKINAKQLYKPLIWLSIQLKSSFKLWSLRSPMSEVGMSSRSRIWFISAWPMIKIQKQPFWVSHWLRQVRKSAIKWLWDWSIMFYILGKSRRRESFRLPSLCLIYRTLRSVLWIFWLSLLTILIPKLRKEPSWL